MERQKYQSFSDKIMEDFKNGRNKKILEKLKTKLPDLMERNLKLVGRLNDKLKVSSFLNNTEHKNRTILKNFVKFSDKRVRDLKTGLGLKHVMQTASRDMSRICQNINSDFIMQNSTFLMGEKKLLNENTEKETHIKINEYLKDIQSSIKPEKFKKNDDKKQKMFKSISAENLNNALNIIDNKISFEQNNILLKINKYKSKLKSFNNNDDPKEFRRSLDNIYIKDKMKLLNYKKPKTIPIHDEEGANMIRIRKCLYAYHRDKNNAVSKSCPKIDYNNCIEEEEEEKEEEKEKEKEEEFINTSGNGKDSFNIIKFLSHESKNLPSKAAKNLKKISDQIDLNLPYYSNYLLILKYCQSVQKNKNSEAKNINKDDNQQKEKEKVINNKSYSNEKEFSLPELRIQKPLLFNDVLSLKKDINNININKIKEICDNLYLTRINIKDNIGINNKNKKNYFVNNNENSLYESRVINRNSSNGSARSILGKNNYDVKSGSTEAENSSILLPIKKLV